MMISGISVILYTVMIAVIVLICLLGPSLIEACGQKPNSNSRIVNGENASPHAWPWQISLRVNGRHICGGSLIDADWVVTAAHCVDRNPRPSGYTVVVGAHLRTGRTQVQQEFRLRKLFMHEGFSMRHLRNDIALLQLQKPVEISTKVNTVCLPSSGSRAKAGAKCYITGWGRTEGGGNAAGILQQAILPVRSHSDCARVNGRLVTVDQNSMICAGGEGKGGCQGDSGGPFVCKEGGHWVLRGAVSWGHSMCRTDHYTVFARISNFIEWINKKRRSGGGGGGDGEEGEEGGGGSRPGCFDNDRRCPKYARYCRSNQNVKRSCKKTCKLC